MGTLEFGFEFSKEAEILPGIKNFKSKHNSTERRTRDLDAMPQTPIRVCFGLRLSLR